MHSKVGLVDKIWRFLKITGWTDGPYTLRFWWSCGVFEKVVMKDITSGVIQLLTLKSSKLTTTG